MITFGKVVSALEITLMTDAAEEWAVPSSSFLNAFFIVKVCSDSSILMLSMRYAGRKEAMCLVVVLGRSS